MSGESNLQPLYLPNERMEANRHVVPQQAHTIVTLPSSPTMAVYIKSVSIRDSPACRRFCAPADLRFIPLGRMWPITEH